MDRMNFILKCSFDDENLLAIQLEVVAGRLVLVL
jgi:hypothetical protein